jgi:2-polyprenyl-3-methyl-5-hydroxy-6-metoxy-1,4-benzoquinol methylase
MAAEWRTLQMADRRDTYTHGHHASVLRSHDARTAQNSAAYLLSHLQPGVRVLDVGCGPGSITRDFAALVEPAVVIGIENVEPPLGVARAAAETAGIANIRFELGDVYALDFPDASFDVVHAHQVLQHLSDPVAALREMGRVCAPGGVVAARDADYAAMTWYPASAGMTRWLELYRGVARGNDAEPDAGRRLLSWAQQAGYADITSSASVWCYATPAERAAWGGGWADRVTSSAFGTQAIDSGLADESELAEIAKAWRQWTDQPDGWFTVLHGEILCAPS